MRRHTCPICIESVSFSKCFSCPSCEYTTCKGCVKKYITSVFDDPNCMNCHRLFDRDVLRKGLSQTFVNGDLKKHREHVLFDRESSMMPSTQPYVVQEVQRRKNVNLYNTLLEERRVLRNQLWELDRQISDIYAQLVPPLQKDDRRVFVQRCSHECCKGYLNVAWRCETCNMYTCSECHTPRYDHHACNPDDVSTVTMLKKDSRKCPSCGAFIFKLSGCDQMWCTACHTAFCWRTGRVINSNIHNPHFYEYQRNRQDGHIAREHGDIPCGAMPTARELIRAGRAGNISHIDYFLKLHRLIVHVEHEEIARYHATAITDTTNVDLRIRYMLNELPLVAFKQMLQQREKRNHKKRDIEMILQMLCNTMSDLFRQLVLAEQYADVDTRVTRLKDEMNALVAYANDVLLQVSERYKCVVPSLNTDAMRILYIRK